MYHIPSSSVTKEFFLKKFNAKLAVPFDLNRLNIEYLPERNEMVLTDRVRQKKLFLIDFGPNFIILKRNQEFSKDPQVTDVYDVLRKVIKDIAP